MIHVAFGFDDRYAPGAGAAIASIARSAAPDDEITVHVLSRCLDPESERRVRASARGRLEIAWYDVDSATMDGLPALAWMSNATFLRFLVADVVPSTVERVLYLDADVLVRRSLHDLVSMDMGGCPVAAPRNQTTPYVAWPGGLTRFRSLGFDPRDHYYCAGMLLLDTALWREEQLAAQLLDRCRGTSTNDQSALNTVLHGRIAAMPTETHQQPEVYEKWDHGGWVKAIFDESELDLCRHDPLVVTFGGYPKPWLGGNTDHPMYPEWLSAYRWSGWGDTSLPRLGRLQKIRRRMWRAAQVLIRGTYKADHPGW